MHQNKNIWHKIELIYKLNEGVIQVSFGLILVLSIMMFLVHFPSRKPKDYEQFKYSTIGTIEKIEDKTSWSQSFDGASEITIAHTIYYSYYVNEKIYRKQFVLINKPAHKEFLEIFKSYVGRNDFPIKYKPNNPEQSIPDVYGFSE